MMMGYGRMIMDFGGPAGDEEWPGDELGKDASFQISQG